MKLISSREQIPKNMSESEAAKFWSTHAMSEELLEASIVKDDSDLPKKKSVPVLPRLDED